MKIQLASTVQPASTQARVAVRNVLRLPEPGLVAREVNGPRLADLLKAGTAVQGVFKGGGLLIEKVNAVTPEQLGQFLHAHHLVQDSAAAQLQAKDILKYAQSKGASAILWGAVAGAGVVVAVDTLKPHWPLRAKLAIGLVAALAVASLLYWGLSDRSPPTQPATRESAGHVAP